MNTLRLRDRLLGLVVITRPHDCLGAAVVLLLGAYLGGAASLWTWAMALATGVVVSVAAMGTVTNDVCDVTVDQLGKPWRPIPSGRVSRRTAVILASALLVVALALAALLGGWALIIASAVVVLSLAYSYRLKSTVLLGNAAVGLTAAAAVLYGALVGARVTAPVLFAAGLIFLFHMTREVLKSIADCDCDARAGVVTVATRYGATRALRAFQALAIVILVVAPLPWLLGSAPAGYLLAILAGSMAPLLAIVLWLNWRLQERTVHVSLRVMKLMWLCGVFGLALMR